MTIELLTKQDVDKYCELRKMLDRETSFFMAEEGEREWSRILILGRMNKPNWEERNPIFIAKNDSKIIGSIWGFRGKFKKNQHTLYLGLGVRKDLIGRGTGSALFKKMMDWKEKNLISRVEIEVFSTNHSGLAFFKSKGFEIEGIKRNAIFVNNRFVDIYIMSIIG